MKKTVVVMPVANEEKTIGNVIEQIMGLPYDNLYLFVVMDSYSRDRTEAIVREAEQKYNGRVRCIFYQKSKGVVTCYLYGFHMALKFGAEYVIEMDGGGSHDPAAIPLFIEALDDGYQCAWGSRFIKGGGIHHQPLYRRMLSSGGTVLSNIVLGTRLKDMTSGFEAFRADVLRSMNLGKFLSRGHMYQTEMRFYCRNYPAKEIPIQYIGGESSLKLKSVTEALRILFQLKSHEKCVHKSLKE